jgi:hypothetical protein
MTDITALAREALEIAHYRAKCIELALVVQALQEERAALLEVAKAAQIYLTPPFPPGKNAEDLYGELAQALAHPLVRAALEAKP